MVAGILAALFLYPLLYYYLLILQDLIPGRDQKFITYTNHSGFFKWTPVVFILQLLLGFIFGRIYCSTLCPAGVLQDIITVYIVSARKRKKEPAVIVS